jgi:hypothetical protein
MAKEYNKSDLQTLPECAKDFINLVIRRMRYRKNVQADVQAELSAHFEDELRDCKTAEEKLRKAQQLIEDFGDAKLLGVLLRRAKKRCRPLWRTVVARTFQTVGVLILCFTLYVIWFLTGRPVVTVDYVAELNRLVKPVADESLNAAPFFDEAAISSPNMPDKEALFWSKSYADTNDAERQIIEAWLNDSLHGFALVSEGVRKTYHWQQYRTAGAGEDANSVMNILLPHLAKYREIARGLCWRAQMKAAKGQYEPAFEDLVTCYKFGRLIKGGEKTLIEQLVGIAIQALATKTMRQMLDNYEIGADDLTALHDQLQSAKSGEDFAMHLLFEKLCVYDEIQRCFTEDRLGGGHPYLPRLMSLGEVHDIGLSKAAVVMVQNPRLLFHPNKRETREMIGQFYDSYGQVSAMTPSQLRAKGIAFGEKLKEFQKDNIFLRILLPPLGKVHQLIYRMKADVEATFVVLAAKRCKIDKGTYPQNLNELIDAGYLTSLPIDPYSDKPLLYRRTAEGFTLYSVSQNFTDDGGQVYRDKEGKPMLWADEGDAVFWPVQK